MRLTSKERAYQRQLQGGFGSRFRNMTDDQFRAKVQPERFAGNTEQFIGGLGTASVNTDRGPSPIIWANFPSSEIRENPNKGTAFWDDFTCFGLTTAVASNKARYAGEAGVYRSWEDTTTASINVLNVAAALPPAIGVIELATDNAANRLVAAMEGGAGGVQGSGAPVGSFSITGNTFPALYFEARVRVNQATVSTISTFVGLAEANLTAAGSGTGSVFTTADILNTTSAGHSLLGFYSVTATPTVVRAVYQKNGATQINVTNGAGTGLYVAQTWTKLGFSYEPNDKDGRILKYYQDGNLLGWVTDCSSGNANFPQSALASNKGILTPLILLQKDATASASAFDMDWWKVGVKVMQ